MAKKRVRSSQGDLAATISQSTVDKLLSSVSYPFTVIEVRKDFPKAPTALRVSQAPGYKYTDREAKKLLKDAVDYVTSKGGPMNPTLANEVYSAAGSIIEQAEKVSQIQNKSGHNYQGPQQGDLKAIVDGGIEGLVDSLGGDLDIVGWCPYLHVVVERKPSLQLASPRIALSGFSITVTATGELWFKHPWWNCYKWCTTWEKVIKWEKVASITVSVTINADAHADLVTKGAEVLAYASFDRLRLGGDIFDKIPLEGFANDALGNKPVFVYDASKLVQTVPVLGSKFTVDSVNLPPNPSGISVGVNIKQVKKV